MELTWENKRSLLQAEIKNLYPGEKYAWVEDMTDNKAFYNYDGKTYQVSYSISKDNEIKLGNPMEVIKQVVYHGVRRSDSKRRIE